MIAALYAEHPAALHACTETLYWGPKTYSPPTEVALPVLVLQVPPLWQYLKV